MIYLIDDKKPRQENMGWPSEMLEIYNEVLFPIYTNDSLQKSKHLIFNDNNIILFHESFFDTPINFHPKDCVQIRRDITEYSTKKNCIVIFFGGSIGSRNITGQTAHIPVEILYSNLGALCKSYKESSSDPLKEIVFGTSDIKEELLRVKLEIWESLYDEDNDNKLDLNQTQFEAIKKLEEKVNRKIFKEGISSGFLKHLIQKLK
ncbi:MAG: hypothetical protein ACOYOV_02965 [Bacteroidales bacterium]